MLLTPIELKEFPGFYPIPGYPDYAVSKSGDVIDVRRGSETTLHQVKSGGYLCCTLYGKSVGLHRIMSSTFIEKPELDEVLVVNHIDGDKQNNSLENLEWVTYSENSSHAYRTGLRNDNRHVDVRNLDTKHDFSFFSLQECARAFRKNGAFIHGYIKRKGPVLTEKGWCLFKYSEDEWPDYDSENYKHQWVKGHCRPVIGRNECTGECRKFISITKAAEELGVHQASIQKCIKIGYKTRSGWSFEFSNDEVSLDSESEKYYRSQMKTWQRAKRKQKRVLLTSIESGEVKEYENSDALAAEWNISKNTLQCRFNRNDGVWNGFKVEYR